MAIHNVLDVAWFRNSFIEFQDPTAYPDIMLNAWYANAGNYISQSDAYEGLTGSSLDFALQLLTAHLLHNITAMGKNQNTGVVTGSTVGDISVTLQPPPVKSGWEFWLSSSAYGIQLWAFLSSQSVGGWSIGGYPETHVLRRAGGYH